ncbi:hypothetical protein [Nocardioides pyridinolyticus]
MMIVRRGLAIVLSLVLGAAALSGAPALAKDGGAAKDGPARVNCAGSSDVRLTFKGIDGNSDRFIVVGAVFSNDDDIWDWTMRHNGDVSAQGDVQARDDIDRSFRISRSMLDFYGVDDVGFRAVNRRTGEVCRISRDY